MKKYIMAPVALGVAVGLLASEALGESKSHAEFVAVSPTPSPNIVFTNTTASMVTISGRFDTFAPVEWKISRDHFVVDTFGLPVERK